MSFLVLCILVIDTDSRSHFRMGLDIFNKIHLMSLKILFKNCKALLHIGILNGWTLSELQLGFRHSEWGTSGVGSIPYRLLS